MTIPEPERFLHRRTKGPVSTPAARLIELQQEMNLRGVQLDEAQVRIAQLERQLDRYQRMTDSSFAGIPMAQIWADLWLWEAVLNDNPKLQAMIELGTWKGALSWWLWAQAKAREMDFRTIDVIDPERYVPEYVHMDIFAEAAQIKRWIATREPCLVICDGGNKPRELATFSDELRHPDSLISVHDWGTEVTPKDIPPGVRMVYTGICDEIGSITRFFRTGEDDDA